MPIPEIKTGAKLVIGSKQTRTALEKGVVIQVYIAEDAESRIVQPIAEICAQKGVQVIKVASMSELGKACRIQVGAAAAAVTK